MLLAILGSISLCSEALSQTPDQHRAILDRLDLSHREPELSKRVIWNQTDLIPMCRKNFRAYSTCDGKTYQLLQWPNNRSDQVYSTDTSFLSHQLANRLSSSTYVGKYSVTYKYCTEDVIRSLSAWQAQNTGINRDDTISLTYLSPASPWFVCFSRDKFRVAHELEKTGQFDQEHYEFWLWINGRVVGDIECDTGFNPYGNSRVFPQCGVHLHFSNGEATLKLAPFPAVNLETIIGELNSITAKFWDATSLDTQAYGIDVDFFNRPVTYDAETATVLKKIQRHN